MPPVRRPASAGRKRWTTSGRPCPTKSCTWTMQRCTTSPRSLRPVAASGSGWLSCGGLRWHLRLRGRVLAAGRQASHAGTCRWLRRPDGSRPRACTPGTEGAAEQRAEQEHDEVSGGEGAVPGHIAEASARAEDWCPMAGNRRPLADVACSPLPKPRLAGQQRDGGRGQGGNNQRGGRSVHSPAMAPCLTREPAAADRPARPTDVSPVATGADSASSTLRVIAVS